MTCRAYVANDMLPSGEGLVRGVLGTALERLDPTEAESLTEKPVEPFEDIR